MEKPAIVPRSFQPKKEIIDRLPAGEHEPSRVLCRILSERNGMKPGTIHYTKPGELEYDLNFIKKDGKIYHHDGLTPTDGDMSAEPVPAKF